MKKITFKKLAFIPASHEDKTDPGSLKKVFFTFADFPPNSRLQMINWAKLPVGKSFNSHYHEDMDEVFIILSGKVKIETGGEEEILEVGDAVFIPMKEIHKMENIGEKDVNYLAIGVSLGKGGKTVVNRI
jgi:mannose-6-phosphate isomerase-like protein (cupin superfamily)